MRQGFRAVVAGGLGFAVSLIAACGSSTGLLSADTATSLTNQLQQVSSDLQQGNCAAAHDELAKLSQDIQNLPSSVSSTLRSNLNEGLTRAQELAATQCKSPTSTTPTTTTATTTTPTTTTETATQPTTTQTTPTQTTPTTTPPATTPVNPGTTSTGPGSGGVAPGTNNGNGKGNGNGNGH
jgi:cell division protein FtsN